MLGRMLDSTPIAVTHRGFLSTSATLCLALWLGCQSGSLAGDAGVEQDAAALHGARKNLVPPHERPDLTFIDVVS